MFYSLRCLVNSVVTLAKDRVSRCDTSYLLTVSVACCSVLIRDGIIYPKSCFGAEVDDWGQWEGNEGIMRRLYCYSEEGITSTGRLPEPHPVASAIKCHTK